MGCIYRDLKGVEYYMLLPEGRLLDWELLFLLNRVEVATVQNRFNPFFHESPHGGTIKYCTDNGIGYLAYSPVGGGRLNKKLPGHPVVQPIAEARGATPHAVVLAWVLAQAPNVIIIPGARTEGHALDSAAAAELELSPEELQAIDEGEFSTA